ncbi:Ankyrin repeat-containing protein BDA1 [Linum perenne]
MDLKLMEACQSGNVNILHQLLRSNPFLLHLTPVNPLHMAAIAGHVDFTKEILKLKPELAIELNQDGFSALHYAAANGKLEIVRELVKVNKDLCRIQGIDKKTPLHSAAVRGKGEVIMEMVMSCPDCVEDVSDEKETALHLAVKNSQFGAIKVLVDWIAEMNKGRVLNSKDEQGNTVLHLASWKKHRQVIELLVAELEVEVNAMNNTGLTALDLMLMFPSEAGDREIMEILVTAGAVRGREVLLLNPQSQLNGESSCSQEKDMEEYFKFKKGRDSPSDARSALLVIAVLVATATFQLGVNPPGGVWQEDTYMNNTRETEEKDDHKSHIAGESIMGTRNGVAFSIVAVFNTVGFSTALLMISILTTRFPLQLELQICMIAMYVTYNTSIINVSPDGVQMRVILTTAIFPVFIGIIARLARKPLECLKQFVKNMGGRRVST